jgi:uncharacterized OB-fold protein
LDGYLRLIGDYSGRDTLEPKNKFEKCPNCGAALGKPLVKCPNCGVDLIEQFARKVAKG